LDEALEAAARLSHRYIPSRQLPDKAVSLIDTACARVAISQHATPPRVEDCQRRIEALRTESEILDRETAVGLDHAERHTGVKTQPAEQEKEWAKLPVSWQREKGTVDKTLEVRAKRPPPAPAPKAAPAANGAPAAPAAAAAPAPAPAAPAAPA